MENQTNAILALLVTLKAGIHRIKRDERMKWVKAENGEYGYTVATEGRLTRELVAQAEVAASDYAEDIEDLETAYQTVRARTGNESVFISEVIKEGGWRMATGQAIIRMHEGNQLDTADWSCSTEEQRAAHMMLRDQKRLYVKLN